jgi:hypothetical protein
MQPLYNSNPNVPLPMYSNNVQMNMNQVSQNNMNIMNPFGMMNLNTNVNQFRVPSMDNINMNNNLNGFNNFNMMMNNQNNFMNNNLNNNMNFNTNVNNNFNLNQNMNNNMNFNTDVNNNSNLNQNMNNNMNMNPINITNIIPCMNNLNLNNHKETIYKEQPNYTVSEGTKLILHNNQISRQKLISNNTPISPTLQCAICLDLVMSPVECETCTKLFCKDCIDNWLLNCANECPNKHPFKKIEELDEWIKIALGKIFIKCPFNGCKEDYNYKYWMNHVKKCPFKSKGVMKSTDNATEGDEPFIWENVQFFVKDIHGKSHTFNLPLSTTVKELKEKLEAKTGFKVEAQRLSLNGKPLDNTKMLEFYQLQNNQTILQLGRLKGGNLTFF